MQCIYEVPPGLSFKDVGMNVRVIYDRFRVEILDLDPVEGFTIPDPTKPNQFQLAPGLCSGPNKIKSVAASTTCVSKNAYQPLCASNSTTTVLAPAPSAVYLLVDQDNSMVDFLGPTIDPTSNLDVALGLALQDPVFMTTTISVRRVPDDPQECTSTTYGNGTFATFDPTAMPSLLAPLLLPPVTTTGLALDALLAATGAYGVNFGGPAASFNERAVILATNRLLDPSTAPNCGPVDAASAVKAATAAGISTYIFSLRNAFESPSTVQTRMTAATTFAMASGATVFSAEGGNQ